MESKLLPALEQGGFAAAVLAKQAIPPTKVDFDSGVVEQHGAWRFPLLQSSVVGVIRSCAQTNCASDPPP